MSEIRHEPRARTVASSFAGGHTIDRHRHDDHQLVYVSTGVLAVTTAAGSWVASRDRAVWIPAGTWHEHRFYGASRFHTVGFPAERPPLDDAAPTIVAVSSLLRELLVACTDPALAGPEGRRLRAVVRDRLRRSAHAPMSLPAPRDPRLADACAAVAQRLAHPITLTELARSVGASERTLSRLFRDELGMSYPQWRTNLRLLNAMILLSDGVSVTATAERCGWSTTSGFVEVFRRTLGQTPGAFRGAGTEPAQPAAA